MKIHTAEGIQIDISTDVAQMHAERKPDPHNGVVTFDGILRTPRPKPVPKVEREEPKPGKK